MTGTWQMNDRAFVDTNIFVYIYSEDENIRREISQRELDKYDCIISTQVLNEFSNICIKKLNKTTEEIELAIDEMVNECILLPIEIKTIKKALFIHKKYTYGYYDSLMIASALLSECKYFLSEDLSDGQIIENKLKIVNIYS